MFLLYALENVGGRECAKIAAMFLLYNICAEKEKKYLIFVAVSGLGSTELKIPGDLDEFFE